MFTFNINLSSQSLLKNNFFTRFFMDDQPIIKSFTNSLLVSNPLMNMSTNETEAEQSETEINASEKEKEVNKIEKKNNSVTKKYCIYFPYRLDVDELKSIQDYDQLYKVIKRYLIDDDELDDKLSLIKRFIRYNQEQELILLRFQNKINAILFSREGYKPFNILPVINDLEHNQSFIAISQEWYDLFNNDVNTNVIKDDIIVSEEIIDIIQNIYDDHKQELIPMIERVVERLLMNHFN